MSDDTVDKELRRQLEAASPASEVGAVFTLRSHKHGSFLTAEETQSAAKRVVDAATHSTGSAPQSVQVFANLQSFAVQGSKALVSAIMQQPEVETAMANQQPESALIKPIKRRHVEKKRSSRSR